MLIGVQSCRIEFRTHSSSSVYSSIYVIASNRFPSSMQADWATILGIWSYQSPWSNGWYLRRVRLLWDGSRWMRQLLSWTTTCLTPCITCATRTALCAAARTKSSRPPPESRRLSFTFARRAPTPTPTPIPTAMAHRLPRQPTRPTVRRCSRTTRPNGSFAMRNDESINRRCESSRRGVPCLPSLRPESLPRVRPVLHRRHPIPLLQSQTPDRKKTPQQQRRPTQTPSPSDQFLRFQSTTTRILPLRKTRIKRLEHNIRF